MLTPPSPEMYESVPVDAGAAADRRFGLTPVSLFIVLLLAYLLIQIKLVLILTLLAILFATLIERPLQQLERRRIPRGVGILLIYITILASVGLLSFLIAPFIANEARIFTREAPDQLRELRVTWQGSRNPFLNGAGQQLLGRAIQAVEAPPVPREAAVGFLTGVGGVIVGMLTLFVIAFYYLMEKTLLRRLVLLEVRPGARARVNRVWDDVEAKIGDWLRGQLTLCLIIGVTATIGYGILRVRFWPLLGLLAGITELIPIVGPWLGGVPAVIVALTQSWQKALLVAGFIVLLQFMENTILVPRIMRGAVGLTPLTVFVAILAGAEFMGPPGALLAIPVAGVVQVLVTDYLGARREASRAAGTPPLPAWRWMRGYLQPTAPYAPTAGPTEAQGRRGETATAAAGRRSGPSSWPRDLTARATVAPAPEDRDEGAPTDSSGMRTVEEEHPVTPPTNAEAAHVSGLAHPKRPE